ncbi:hypothetical protein [Microbacterium sp.]|jgi:hypothetical protein|uniref:hypothetical protein n=1 Tax=Microbacterium sp. TaxID=51671 RepID=UPI0037C9EDBE
MDPFFALAAEFWWLGPTVIAGGAASFAGIRYGRRQRARALEYAGAKHELAVARVRLFTARAQAKSAQATLLVAKSARQSGRGSVGEIEAARHAVSEAQRELRSAQTGLRGRRVQVKAAKALMRRMPRGDEHLPLSRLVAEHDAVLSSWMAYETDPAKAIAFPTMSDARVPATAALLTAMDTARWLRPRPGKPTLTPEEFARYRTAVTELEAAFHTAEAAAWRAAGASGRPPGAASDPGVGSNVPPQLRGAWDDLVENARAAAVTAAAAATESARDTIWRAAKRNPRTDDNPSAPDAPPRPASAPPPSQAPTDSSPREAASDGAPPPPDKRNPIWPIPRRSAD